jgi:hypothetical protein
VKISKHSHDLGNYQKTHVKYKNIPKCKPDFLSYLRPKVYFNYTLIIIKKTLVQQSTNFFDSWGKEIFLLRKKKEKNLDIPEKSFNNQ